MRSLSSISKSVHAREACGFLGGYVLRLMHETLYDLYMEVGTEFHEFYVSIAIDKLTEQAT